MKVSLFKIGIVLVILGAIWISVIFSNAEKVNDAFFLKQSSSFESKIMLEKLDIGFYKIYIPDFSGEQIFVQVLDIQDNVIKEQIIQTKMSVGYFDFYEKGIYTLKIANVSKNPINLEIEFGNTDSQEMIPGGILLFLGAMTIIVMSYLKIKNHNMAQPDENIS